jgi:hypothetical protein
MERGRVVITKQKDKLVAIWGNTPLYLQHQIVCISNTKSSPLRPRRAWRASWPISSGRSPSPNCRRRRKSRPRPCSDGRRCVNGTTNRCRLVSNATTEQLADVGKFQTRAQAVRRLPPPATRRPRRTVRFELRRRRRPAYRHIDSAVLARRRLVAGLALSADHESALRHPVTLQLGGYGIGPSQREALIIPGGARRIGIPGDLNG